MSDDSYNDLVNLPRPWRIKPQLTFTGQSAYQNTEARLNRLEGPVSNRFQFDTTPFLTISST